ncbi:MAG: ligand-binding sensor domain-containing protein, partial [Bacteroidales bacterium]
MKRLLLLVFTLSLFLFDTHANIFFKHLGKAEGLPQISVISISQDELGRMWFGTLEGLCSYDGNSITTYKPSEEDKTLILGNEVHNLVCDKNGSVFFTSDNALIRYDLLDESFTYLRKKVNSLSVQGKQVFAATADSVFKWNSDLLCFDFVYQVKDKKTISQIYSDPNNCLWLGTTKGLYRIDNLSIPSEVCVIPDVHVHSLYRDSKARMWVAGYRKGMYKIENGISSQVRVEKDFLISDNDVRCFLEDDDGSIWIGTFDGLNKIDTLNNVVYYKKDTQPGSLKHASVFSLYKDMQGTIWIGTYYGGVHYFNPRIDCFKHYSEDSDRNNCLSFFFVGNMVEDRKGDVWICTEGGGLNRLDRTTGLFSHYLNKNNSGGRSFYNLKCIEYDSVRNCLYTGTHKQGLFTFDIDSEQVQQCEDMQMTGSSLSQVTLCGDSLLFVSEKGLRMKNLNTGSVGYLYPSVPETHKPGISFLIDKDHFMWIARHDKIIKINTRNLSEKRIYDYGTHGIGRFHVLKITEAPDGSLYFGTYGAGLYKYNKGTDLFEKCPDVNVRYCYDLLASDSGYLAIANESGLLIYHPQLKYKRMIDTDDQLHLAAINDGCGLLLCRDGEMFVGGTSGMTSFNSNSLLAPSPEYDIYFSAIRVNNRFVTRYDSPNILGSALPFASRIDLKYDENNLSLTVASNSYIDNAHRKLYEYRLEGLSKEWSPTYNNNIIFTNLDPGDYKLIVREKQQVPQDEIHWLELPVIVHPPLWATWYAKLMYVCVFLILSYTMYRNWRTKTQLRTSLAREKIENEKNEELTQAKIQFFTNISHEFRTPLTLIISQIEALLQTGNHSPFLKQRLQKIYRNTFQFRELISELLDFNKMERSSLSLQVAYADVVLCMKEVSDGFYEQARLKNINFSFRTDEPEVMAWFDSRQLGRVFSNLLSNAFRHTSENGEVVLHIGSADDKLQIKVVDSGEGIPDHALPYIFDRFYQVNPSVSSPGSGIGLALSKGIIDLHHGEISVTSTVQYGT